MIMKIAVIPIFNPKIAGRVSKANNMALQGVLALHCKFHIYCVGARAQVPPGHNPRRPKRRQSNQPSTTVLMWALGVKIAIVR